MTLRSGMVFSAIIALGIQSRAVAEVTDSELRTNLQQRIDKSKADIGIVVGIIDAGGTRIISCGNEGSYNGDTVFEIGSVTKVFTSLILADMVTRGEVKVDDPISKYLPNSVKVPKRGGREITFVDLSTHSSGLPRLPGNLSFWHLLIHSDNPYAGYTVQEMYDFLSTYTLPRDIGAEYEYSNLGAGLLGHVLALKAGTDYEALVLERVCRPLGMTNTLITLSPEMKERMAQGHNAAGKAVPNWDMPALAGAGALRSTGNDLLKLVAANMGLTKSSLTPAMELEQVPRHDTDLPNTRVALAWHITKTRGIEMVWHNGGTGGFRTFIGFDKKNHRGVVVLTNSANDKNVDVDEIGGSLLANELDAPADEAKSSTVRH
jgi:CubicO group peptidase (beta-lactamase class C family)